MMIRNGNRAVETFDLRLVDHPESPVTRRYVAPVIEPEPPVRPFVLSEPALTAARSRGGTNAAKRGTPRLRRDDAPLWAALREHGGNIAAAAETLGRGRSTVRSNIHYRRASGDIPADVLGLLANPASRHRGFTGHHTPETRALISIRLRELYASRRAA